MGCVGRRKEQVLFYWPYCLFACNGTHDGQSTALTHEEAELWPPKPPRETGPHFTEELKRIRKCFKRVLQLLDKIYFAVYCLALSSTAKICSSPLQAGTMLLTPSILFFVLTPSLWTPLSALSINGSMGTEDSKVLSHHSSPTENTRSWALSANGRTYS